MGRMIVEKSRSSLRLKRRFFSNIKTVIILFILISIATVFGINEYVKNESSSFIVSFADVPTDAEAILVLGAFVRPDGSVSNILYDRLIVALNLFNAGKAPKILVSGDHGQTTYDEVNAMKKFLEDRGVEGSKIFMDHAGFSTYESVYRSKEVFQVKKVIIVTQKYHLMRAIFNARKLGIEAYGVTSDLNEYRGMTKFALREFVARNKDFWYSVILKPKPTYLGPVIPISGDGGITHDKAVNK